MAAVKDPSRTRKDELVAIEREGARVGPAGASAEAQEAGEFGELRLLVARLLCLSGLVTAAVGIVQMEVSLESVALVMGVVGYALGARTLGVATIVIATILMLATLAIGVGEIPGIAPTDPQVTPNS